MADISTGRQRGIVPFVDETTGRLPDSYLPQGVIDLQGDLEQAVTNASQSATAAKASETAAKASADSATQSASAAAQSAESASDDATAAKASADGAASSAGAAKASETAAASSATAAAESKDAAKASETAAARSAQTATEQVSSIGDSVEQAAASATAAQQSASRAQSNATAAGSAAQAAAAAAAAAQTATESAASSKDAAARSASKASASAQAAEASRTNAASSAAAAKASETNAAASASAAKTSETNAADSATAAQQAVDGFGLQVGTTTTGEPGTDAAVEIQKNGTKYTANFTIPRGDVGPAGVNENVPTRTVSGLIAHADDAYPVAPREIRIHGGSFSRLNLLGKNFAVASSATSDRGNKAIVNDDGSITVKAVAADTYDYLFLKDSGKILVPGVEFAISLTDKSGAPVSDIVGYLSVTGSRGPIDIAHTNAVNHGVAPDDYISDRFQICIPPNVSFNGTVFMQIEYGNEATSWEKPIVYGAPVNGELAQGDTLVISEDGSCRVERASGEPTQLDPIEPPVLPSPTFNVYTDSVAPPTVNVTYEQDVNIVIANLEAKIAALQVADKTN